MSRREGTSWQAEGRRRGDEDLVASRRSYPKPSSSSIGPSAHLDRRQDDRSHEERRSQQSWSDPRAYDEAQRHRYSSNGRDIHHRHPAEEQRALYHRPGEERRMDERRVEGRSGEEGGWRERRADGRAHDERRERSRERKGSAPSHHSPLKRSSEADHQGRSHRDARPHESSEKTIPRTPPRTSSPSRKRAREGSPRSSHEYPPSSSSSRSHPRTDRGYEDEQQYASTQHARSSIHSNGEKDSARAEARQRRRDASREESERKARKNSLERQEDKQPAASDSFKDGTQERRSGETRYTSGRGDGRDKGDRSHDVGAGPEVDEREDGEICSPVAATNVANKGRPESGQENRIDAGDALSLQHSTTGAASAANTTAYNTDGAKSTARSAHLATFATLPSLAGEMAGTARPPVWGKTAWPEDDVEDRQRRVRKRNRPPQIPLRERTFYGCSSIDQYNLGIKLGQGTFGEVKKASHFLTGVEVALKKVTIHEEKDGMPITAIREIKLLKKLCHPSIVAVIDMAYRAPTERGRMGEVFMVEPYMDHDLNGMLENPSITFTTAQIKLYMKQLFEGTLYMHQNKILHRDMKAANLLINNRGQLQIADFGLARPYHDPGRAWDTKGWRGGTIGYTSMVVTRWYRPPELLAGDRKYGPPIDMWGLGCILAEMINRKPIFKGTSEIDQLELISKICGSPNEKSYPGWNSLPGVKNADPNGRPDQEPDVPGRHDFGNYPRTLVQHFTMGAFSVRRELADLIDKLLVLNPCDRLTAKEALEHEWFWQPPFPADPGALPTYQASKELDRQRRDQQLHQQQQRAAQAQAQYQQQQLHHRQQQEQAMSKGAASMGGFAPRASNGHGPGRGQYNGVPAGAAGFHSRSSQPPLHGPGNRHPSSNFQGRPAPMMSRNPMARRSYPNHGHGGQSQQNNQQPPPPNTYNPYDDSY